MAAKTLQTTDIDAKLRELLAELHAFRNPKDQARTRERIDWLLERRNELCR